MNLKVSQKRFELPKAVTAEIKRPVSATRAAASAPAARPSTKLIGGAASVFARPMKPEDFIQKLEAAKKNILDAPDFNVAYQENIRADPLLRAAFDAYVSAAMSGAIGATDKKKTDAEVVERRFQVAEFVEFFKEKLNELKALRESTPVDIAALGLTTIQRNKEIQLSTKLPGEQIGPNLLKMAKIASLPVEARKDYLLRAAQAAVQDVSIPEGQTPEVRERAHGQLCEALSELTALGVEKLEILPYYKEALRIAADLDKTSSAAKIRTEAIFLSSTNPSDKKAAEGRLAVEAANLTELSEGRAKTGPLSAGRLLSYRAMVDASARSRTLFAAMPALIDGIQKPEFDAGGTAYRASADETLTFRQLAQRYAQMVGQVFPSVQSAEDRTAHQAAVEGANGLALGLIGMAEMPPALNALIKEMTRHPESVDAAVKLLEMLSGAQKLDGHRDIVLGCLENNRLEQAYEIFSNPPKDLVDNQTNTRQVQIFRAATSANARRKAEEKAAPVPGPVAEWLEGAHLRGLETALSGDHTKVALGELTLLLDLLGSGQVKLDPQQIEDVIAKVTQAFPATNSANFVIGQIPALVGMLTLHPDDISLMNRGKTLVDQYVEIRASWNQKTHTPVTWGGNAVPGAVIWPGHCGAALIHNLSKLELLSGNIHRVAKVMIDHDPAMRMVVAQRLAALGPYAIRDQLAQLTVPEKNLAEIPDFALHLSTMPETTEIARKLIAKYAGNHLGVAATELDAATQIGLVKIEAAMDAAVPNLRTSKAMLGLAQAVQKQEKPFETLELMRAHMPEQLIKEVVGKIDDIAIRDFLAGKPRRERKAAAALPDVGEAIPVANVEGAARVPSA